MELRLIVEYRDDCATMEVLYKDNGSSAAFSDG
jgi:hypothetical protein